MSNSTSNTRGRTVALITAAALAAGVVLADVPAGASPHAAAHVRRAATRLDLTDLTMNTWYTCVGPCAAATYFSAQGVARLRRHYLCVV